MKFGSDGVNGGPNTMLMSFDNWGGNGGNNCVGIGNGADRKQLVPWRSHKRKQRLHV